MASSKVKLSDAIAAPVLNAYKAGGLGLAFLTLGACLMLAAFEWSDRGVITYVVLGVGTLLVFSTLVYFYFKDLRKLIETHQNIKKNADLIDAIQETAIEMTELADTLQALIFKHAVQVKKTLEAIRPFVGNLPLVGPFVESQGTRFAEALSLNVVQTTDHVKLVIRDLRSALIESDPADLDKYLAQIRDYRTELKNLLAQSSP